MRGQWRHDDGANRPRMSLGHPQGSQLGSAREIAQRSTACQAQSGVFCCSNEEPRLDTRGMKDPRNCVNLAAVHWGAQCSRGQRQRRCINRAIQTRHGMDLHAFGLRGINEGDLRPTPTCRTKNGWRCGPIRKQAIGTLATAASVTPNLGSRMWVPEHEVRTPESSQQQRYLKVRLIVRTAIKLGQRHHMSNVIETIAKPYRPQALACIPAAGWIRTRRGSKAVKHDDTVPATG
mmetsp:Transcript_84431/g.272944  ORF Transcript_84431/g.272944 Transcript_84431/m.272944 type:complete len:234 (+) Transcript_84431:973-1674(+)